MTLHVKTVEFSEDHTRNRSTCSCGWVGGWYSVAEQKLARITEVVDRYARTIMSTTNSVLLFTEIDTILKDIS